MEEGGILFFIKSNAFKTAVTSNWINIEILAGIGVPPFLSTKQHN